MFYDQLGSQQHTGDVPGWYFDQFRIKMLRFGHVPCAVTKWDSRQFDAYVINYCVNGVIERRGGSTEVQAYLGYFLLIATTSIQPNIQQSVKFSNLVRKRFSDLENIPPELESSSEKKNSSN